MDVLRSAFSLVIHKNGDVTDADVESLLAFFATNKGITVDRHRFNKAVDSAKELYSSQSASLFICTDKPCLKKTFILPCDQNLEKISAELNCHVEATGCHWQCEQAPVVTAKVGQTSRSFPQCSNEDTWSSVRDFVKTRTSGMQLTNSR